MRLGSWRSAGRCCAYSFSALTCGADRARERVQAFRCARPCRDAGEPRGDVRERGVEWLADAAAEVERTVEDDVGDGEAVAGDPALAGEERVEPSEVVACRCLEAVRRLREHAHPRLE